MLMRTLISAPIAAIAALLARSELPNPVDSVFWAISCIAAAVALLSLLFSLFEEADAPDVPRSALQEHKRSLDPDFY